MNVFVKSFENYLISIVDVLVGAAPALVEFEVNRSV